jgi:asparagine synthase (glutamine-hydrolysing)
MCGILGQINKEKQVDKGIFDQMLETMVHRGPDGAGTYYSNDHKVALGHRRLALIDLSERAAQPMCNEDRTLWLTINGEIYNYPELRRILLQKGHKFHSDSDSEIILHGYEEWGFDVLSHLKGMFALGLWDEKKQILFLARDRFGIKPLYYYQGKNSFVFSSEIKGIVKSPDFTKEIDYSSFCDFFTYRYIPSPKTIWQKVFKIPPAHYLVLKNDGEIVLNEYWELNTNERIIPEKEAVERVDHLLECSIKEHILSDVPVGSFLSGGYDSSAIVYYLDRIRHATSTFSIGFENWDESEHRYAEIVAEKFGTRHFSKVIGQSKLDLLDKLVLYYDEPIADISIVPTYIVSQLAHKNVKAVLSGEGADEIFSGYSWHKKGPGEMETWSKLHYYKDQLLSSNKKFSVDDYGSAMAMGFFGDLELEQLLNFDLHNDIPADSLWFYRQHYRNELSPVKRFQYLDVKTFMGELVLTKIDRASMANSLEVRVPYLDHELVEFVFGLSEKVYIKKDVQKFLLRENISNNLPAVIMDRNKQGFVGPDSYYMDMDWYSKILSESKLIRDLVIDNHYTDKLLANKDHWRLWKIVVMEKWYSKWAI